MKCSDCKHSATAYDYSICAWRAICHSLGSVAVVSEYTENEDDAPAWDKDLGQTNSYCIHFLGEGR